MGKIIWILDWAQFEPDVFSISKLWVGMLVCRYLFVGSNMEIRKQVVGRFGRLIVG